jgi:hypothetical protein
VYIGPRVPDLHTILLEIIDMAFASEEPEKLYNDTFPENLLGRQKRELTSPNGNRI